MGWFDNLTEGGGVKLGGIVGDVFSSGYKAYQTKRQASQQAGEYSRAGAANAKLALENEKAAKEQAKEAQKKTERELMISYEKTDRIIGAQKQGFANSGVIVSAGSAKVVTEQTAEQGRINASIIFHNGKTEIDRAKDLARRYRLSAVNSLNEAASAGYLIESAAGTEIGNITGATLAKTGKSVYDLGTSQGWWGAPTTTKYAGAGTYGVNPGDPNWH